MARQLLDCVLHRHRTTVSVWETELPFRFFERNTSGQNGRKPAGSFLFLLRKWVRLLLILPMSGPSETSNWHAHIHHKWNLWAPMYEVVQHSTSPVWHCTWSSYCSIVPTGGAAASCVCCITQYLPTDSGGQTTVSVKVTKSQYTSYLVSSLSYTHIIHFSQICFFPHIFRVLNIYFDIHPRAPRGSKTPQTRCTIQPVLWKQWPGPLLSDNGVNTSTLQCVYLMTHLVFSVKYEDASWLAVVQNAPVMFSVYIRWDHARSASSFQCPLVTCQNSARENVTWLWDVQKSIKDCENKTF